MLSHQEQEKLKLRCFEVMVQKKQKGYAVFFNVVSENVVFFNPENGDYGVLEFNTGGRSVFIKDLPMFYKILIARLSLRLASEELDGWQMHQAERAQARQALSMGVPPGGGGQLIIPGG